MKVARQSLAGGIVMHRKHNKDIVQSAKMLRENIT